MNGHTGKVGSEGPGVFTFSSILGLKSQNHAFKITNSSSFKYFAGINFHELFVF